MSVRSSTRTRATRTWATRSLAVAAATASAVALGGFATAANADSAWDTLAECESNQNWDINTGNGYYGGLQFAKSSWDAAGGQQYANYPHDASRSEQIAVAENLLAKQGAGAWPACTDTLGLSTADLRGSSGGSDQSEARESAPEEDSSRDEDSGSPEPVEERSSDDVEASTDGTYRVRSGDTLAEIAARLDVDGGWEALYRANDDVIATPGVIVIGQTLAVPGAAQSPDSSGATHRVVAGESLVSIAGAESVDGGWRALFEANQDSITDPGVIQVGQVLDLP